MVNYGHIGAWMVEQQEEELREKEREREREKVGMICSAKSDALIDGRSIGDGGKVRQVELVR